VSPCRCFGRAPATEPKTRQPFVQLHHGDWSIQCSPDEARQLAQSIIEAAEAAEQDGFLMEWAKESIGADDGVATMLLTEYRQWREARRKREDEEMTG
jgi:hypothetical protein